MCRQNEALIEELSIPPPGSQPLHFETKYAQNALSQFRLIFWKCAPVQLLMLLLLLALIMFFWDFSLGSYSIAMWMPRLHPD